METHDLVARLLKMADAERHTSYVVADLLREAAAALAAPPAAPPEDLVALLERWKASRLALRDAEDPMSYDKAEQVYRVYEGALLKWTPATPRVPETPQGCVCVDAYGSTDPATEWCKAEGKCRAFAAPTHPPQETP